jgi:hypothetical protein
MILIHPLRAMSRGKPSFRTILFGGGQEQVIAGANQLRLALRAQLLPPPGTGISYTMNQTTTAINSILLGGSVQLTTALDLNIILHGTLCQQEFRALNGAAGSVIVGVFELISEPCDWYDESDDPYPDYDETPHM